MVKKALYLWMRNVGKALVNLTLAGEKVQET